MGRASNAEVKRAKPTLLPSGSTGWLPVRAISDAIVVFSLQQLGWIHCALDVARFNSEYEAFWDEVEAGLSDFRPKHSWMALYYSVLTVRYYDPIA
jgi:hypothetical protein